MYGLVFHSSAVRAQSNATAVIVSTPGAQVLVPKHHSLRKEIRAS